MRNKENKVKCKMGIGKELFIFLLAVLAGAIVRLAYRCISCLREVVHHAHWVIELEDLIYWIGTAIFLFVQILDVAIFRAVKSGCIRVCTNKKQGAKTPCLKFLKVLKTSCKKFSSRAWDRVPRS